MGPGGIVDLDEDTFDDTVGESSQPIIVDFHATWCAPCGTIEPFLRELAEEFAGRAVVARVDVDANGDLTNRFGIRNVPTIVVFRDGLVVDQIVGAAPKGEIRELVERHL